MRQFAFKAFWQIVPTLSLSLLHFQEMQKEEK